MLKFGAIPLKVKLPAILIGLSLLVATLVGCAGYQQLAIYAKDSLAKQITGLAKEGRNSVAGYYATLSLDISDMATSPGALEGFRALSTGWNDNAADPVSTRVADYITNNPEPAGHRKDFVLPPDFNTYNTQHATYHPGFRQWTDLHGFHDFFLIDLSGNVIYTVMKETDFASNLLTGPEKAGPLAKVFAVALADPKAGVHYSDIQGYGPSAGAPASFAAKAITDENGKTIGVFAVQVSDQLMGAAMSSFTTLGKSGEVFLLGSDGLTRSASRFDTGFHILDASPILSGLPKNPDPGEAVYTNVKLADGRTATAGQMRLEVPGLDWRIVALIDNAEAAGPIRAELLRLCLGTLLVVLLAGGLGLLIARSLIRPIIRVSDAIRIIAGGDLSAQIVDAGRNDEVGDIAKSLDALREKLGAAAAVEAERDHKSAEQRLIVDALSVALRELAAGNLNQSIETFFGEQDKLRSDFNQTVERLSEIISIVVETSESIRSRAKEISQSSEDLSNRTETQAATLEETAAALDQLTASIKSAADGAREVEAIVRSARVEAEESGKVVQGAVTAMTEIERSSDQISQIIGVIDDIAFQTNLLALNAGVEAARAGDAGRGFAVVASEVRALAQRSSGAAKEIKSLISASTQHVGRGVEQVGRAGKVLENIVNRVGHISTLVSNIASAAAEQSTGLAEINLGVSQLDQVTQQNAAMVEESTAASQSMSQEAAGLTELVSQFSLRKTPSHHASSTAKFKPKPLAQGRLARKAAPALAAAAGEPVRAASGLKSGGRAIGAQAKWQDF
jgi:methyl-accepting chemotaxis protein